MSVARRHLEKRPSHCSSYQVRPGSGKVLSFAQVLYYPLHTLQ